MTSQEYFHIDNEAWMTCVCGHDELDTCLPDGTYVEPTIDSAWEGHYLCINCGRVVEGEAISENSNLCKVIARVDQAKLKANADLWNTMFDSKSNDA